MCIKDRHSLTRLLHVYKVKKRVGHGESGNNQAMSNSSEKIFLIRGPDFRPVLGLRMYSLWRRMYTAHYLVLTDIRDEDTLSPERSRVKWEDLAAY